MPGTNTNAGACAPIVNVQTPRHFRAPAFLEHKIQVWFTLLEAQFVTALITDDNVKYCNTISSLTEKAIGQLEDILVHPSETEKYIYNQTHIDYIYVSLYAFITLLKNYIRHCGIRTPNLTYNAFYS